MSFLRLDLFFQEEYLDDPHDGPARTYLIDNSSRYGGGGGKAGPQPIPPPLPSLYGTLPRHQHQHYSYDEDLSRQRFIHSLGKELVYFCLLPHL